jgi:hypothetical protein
MYSMMGNATSPLCNVLTKQQCKPERIERFIEAHAQIAHVLPSPTPEFKFRKK